MKVVSYEEFQRAEGVRSTSYVVTFANGKGWECDGSLAIPILEAMVEGNRVLILTDVHVNGQQHQVLIVHIPGVCTIEHLPR